ncbi:MAG TPA: hypothetical protein VLT32_19635 [Candidatus Sulfomarinibacteraceae bacterium]|nr:hypothetical protein [Candidatus Sulfomarinibacteraceae bacterium]
MSNGSQAPPRKGLHPLAWVGIGCGVVLVIVVAALVVGGFFLARTVKDVAQDFEDNPGLAAARFVVKATPELEEVDVDEAAGTMTVRNTKTGEVITVNFEDIKNGRFSWTVDGEEVTVDVSEAEGGTVKIESSKGEGFALSTGAAVSEDIPDWVPVYPGAEAASRSMMTSDEGVTGSFQIETGDAVSDVIAFYRDRLKAAGFEITVNTFSGEGSEGGMVQATLEAGQRSVMVMINREAGPTQASVTYSTGS